MQTPEFTKNENMNQLKLKQMLGAIHDKTTWRINMATQLMRSTVCQV